jgi:hypothetical protein
VARTITPELRAVLDEDGLLCAEIAAHTPDCRAWVSVGANFEGDAVCGYNTTHFEFFVEWMEDEYDPSGDEMPLFETRLFRTEGELDRYLLEVLPESASLIRVADDPDYPL